MALVVLSATHAAAQDTLVTVADGPPVWGEAPDLVEEVRIGVLDGDPDYAFGHVVGVAVTEDGVIWVADSQNAEVRRFDREGVFLGVVAGRGEGPGELGGVSGIKVTPDGGVAVFDAHQSRINFFDVDGSFRRSVTRTDGMQVVGSRAEVFQVFDDGTIYVYAVRLRPRGDPRRSRAVWLELDSDGRVVDSIAVPPSDRTTVGGRAYPFGEMASFTPITRSVLSPAGYLVWGNTVDFAFYRPLRDGRILRIERPWEPVSVQRDERSQYREAAAVFAERWDPAHGLDSNIPSLKPPWWAFRVDEEGRLWVARHSAGVFIPESSDERVRREQFGNPPLEWWEPLIVDVIGPRGRLFGTLRFPGYGTNLGAARGEKVWTIERGEYDEQYVVRYRIESSG